MKKEISLFVKLNYLNYDIDDIYSNNKNLKTEFENEHLKKTRNKKLNELQLVNINHSVKKSINKNIKDEIPLMYNISFTEHNFWDEIIQPKVPIKERNASTQIEMEVNEINKNKNKKDIKNEEDNEENEDEEDENDD